MKNSKKKILVISVIVCLVALVSIGTLAWFNDSDEVTNQFYIATSDSPTNPDDIFSVDVWEYTDGDTENKEQDGEVYKNITPGGRYHKEPYVENTGAYDQWVRVKVTLSDAGAWQEIMAKHNLTDLNAIFEGHDESAWTFGGSELKEDYLTYTYYLNYKLAPGEKACLFTTVVIPGELDQTDMAKLGGDFALNIVAEAVQYDNLGANNAKEAFNIVEGTPTP